MELLTQNFPSGFHYDFPSIKVNPMYFGQILEYLESAPKNPVEKYYFDYKLVLMDDPNVDRLLLSDLDYLIFFKKGLTIASDLHFTTKVECPICGNSIEIEFNAASIRFKKLDDVAMLGLSVEFGGKMRNVRMPQVGEFMKIFSKYRVFKKVTDLRIIKLISLFEDSVNFLQMIEEDVIHAQYKDITLLSMLDQVYFNSVEPIVGYCSKCNDGVDPDKKRGTEIALDGLISNLFRDVVSNNRLTETKIVPREVRQGD